MQLHSLVAMSKAMSGRQYKQKTRPNKVSMATLQSNFRQSAARVFMMQQADGRPGRGALEWADSARQQ
jgi:hypothetical protein